MKFQTIDELIKWLRTTDGWFVDSRGCISLDIEAPSLCLACTGSASFNRPRCTPSTIAEETGLSELDAIAIVKANDKSMSWGQYPKKYDRNLRRRLARACRVKLSQREDK